MMFRTRSSCPRCGVALVGARRIMLQVGTTAALLAVLHGTAHAAGTVGGAPAQPVGPDVNNVKPLHVASSSEHLAVAAIQPLSMKTARDDAPDRGSAAVRLEVEPKVPPSELALLGDGMLVLIALIAGVRARRSRSMAAMTAERGV